MNYNRNRI